MGSDLTTCISCGLKHRLVEAGGIWHCPNKACTVSGNTFRLGLPSFKELPNDKHTVDFREWALAAMTASHEDPVIAKAIDESALLRLQESTQ